MKATAMLAQACQLTYDLKLHRESRCALGDDGLRVEPDMVTIQMNRRIFWLVYATDV